MSKDKSLSLEERELNEAAMLWLHKKGMAASRIRYLRWNQIDKEKGKIQVVRFLFGNEERGIVYKKWIPYHNSPIAELANRSFGKNIFVFYPEKVSTKASATKCKTL